MIEALIRAAIARRGLVLALGALLTIVSLLAVDGLKLDAIPDLSDVQVTVRTRFEGQPPQVVEDQLTYPLTSRLLSVPKAKAVRGFSMFGDSFVYIIFDDDTDLYWARSRVLEALSTARAELPAGVEPQLGPDATGVGWVYQYALVDRSGQTDLAQLRSLQDWFLRFELQRLPGVAEVASVGGFVERFEVLVDPLRLQSYGITFDRVQEAVRAANAEAGGGALIMGESEHAIRGIGYVGSLEDLEQAPLGMLSGGVPVTVGDVARVRLGPAPRRGIAELDGAGEVVGGIVVMRDGENAKDVIDAVKRRLEQLRGALPAEVEIVTTYDRSALIERAVDNLRHKLLEELLFVVVVCAIFLWHLRSSLVIALSLPLGVLVALAIMRWQGLNANIMSLGGIAIAIGAMVDAAIVMVENAHKHLESWSKDNHGHRPALQEHWQVITRACVEVGPALLFSLLVTAFSFLPVFALEAQEGRMFAPLAWTKTWAMVVAALLAITLVPVLIGYWVRGDFKDESEHRLPRLLIAFYRPFLDFALRRPWAMLAAAAVLLIATAWPWSRLGTEFMPELEEGDLLYMPTTLPGLATSEAQALLQLSNRLIRQTPEVATVFGKAGRADSATDPAPLTMIETVIQFKPIEQWRPGMRREDLIAELDQRLQIPGLTNAWVQPILNRINMQVSGIRTELGVRVSAPDLDMASDQAQAIADILRSVPGTASAFAERAASAPYVEIEPDRAALARHGLSMAQLQGWIAGAVGGRAVGTVIDQRQRYPLTVQLPQEWRDSPEALASIPLVTPAGTHALLGELASIRVTAGPSMIRSENAKLAVYVFVDLADGIDLRAYIAEAEAALAERLPSRPGSAWTWQGSYQYLQRAEARLLLAVPMTLLVVFALLYASFRRLPETLIVLTTIPFALIGGIWLLWALGYSLSVAVAVGFIALAGVAAEFGVVMLIYLDAAVRRARNRDGTLPPERIIEALREGALRRVRPKAMTVITIFAGLLPILLASGTGAATMQRIAAPMLGGMLTAPLLSLLVIPALYQLWLRRESARGRVSS